MKRFRDENPSTTKWKRSQYQYIGLWPSVPLKKQGARFKREHAAIAQANANIHRQVAATLSGAPNFAYTVVAQAGGGETTVGPVAAVPDFRIHWDKVPSKATQAALAEVIVAATKHFSRK